MSYESGIFSPSTPPTSDSRLPTSDFRFPIPYSPLATIDTILEVSEITFI